jgi:hypothetical protein
MEVFKSLDYGRIHATHVLSDDRYFCAHVHESCEIYAIFGGNVDYAVGDYSYFLEPLDILIIPPNTYHQWRISSVSPYERLSVHFLPESLCGKERSLLSLFLKGNRSFYYPAGSFPLAALYVRSFTECQNLDEGLREIAFRSRLVTLLTYLLGSEKAERFDCLRRVHTQEPAYAGEPWGETKGMYPESNTLPEQPYPDRSAAGLVDWLCLFNED